MLGRFIPGKIVVLKRGSSCQHAHHAVKCLRTLFSCTSVKGSHHAVQQSKKQRSVPTERVRSKPERQVCQLILDHFDQQYSEELGPLWPSARAVLLNPQSWQYGVMLNRFSSVADVRQSLTAQGFTSLLPQPDTSDPPITTPIPSHLQPQPDTLALPQSHTTPTPFHSPQPETNTSYLPHSVTQPPPCPDSPGQPNPSRHPHPLREPSSLQCFIRPTPVRLPVQHHQPGQLKQYYLLNVASLLPVLALGVRDGDRVLDLCSAPGGKALAILQTATPVLLCCNEFDRHRHDWLSKTLESFIPQSLSDTVTVTNLDGRIFGQSAAGMYDKVLVDAPCSNDRSWLFTSGVQKGAVRLRERAMLPTLQTQLLRSALAAVRPGGVVVYSTCTLSRAENEGVVEAVLSSCPGAELQDLEEELALPLSDHFTFAQSGSARSGLLVVPQQGRTWGPMFLSRIKRTH